MHSLNIQTDINLTTKAFKTQNKLQNQTRNMTSIVKAARPVIKRILPIAKKEGFGDAKVRRSIGGFELNQFDPFLVLDEVISETGTGGFPDHPHRGFETVTYMLQGGVQHEDFEGHKGIIGGGDLQWMTAGRGIIHSEILAGLGKTRALQLWVNLSSQYKMIEPNYQELLSKDIAEVERDGIKVRVIAGDAFGIKSQIYTRTPTMYLDFTLQQGSHLKQPIPASWNSFVYILEGEGVFGDSTTSPAKSSQLLLLGSNGDGVEAWNNSETPLRFVLVGGQPLGEPVAARGPFVMNTPAELEQTFKDYRSFTNGFEKARGWRSDAARRLNM